MRNRGIGRGRMFMGGLLLFAAVIAWFTGLTLSPHTSDTVTGVDHLRGTVATFLRNSAIGTLILCALAGWLLFPARRPKWPARDFAILCIIAVMAASSIYTLIWIQAALD